MLARRANGRALSRARDACRLTLAVTRRSVGYGTPLACRCGGRGAGVSPGVGLASLVRGSLAGGCIAAAGVHGRRPRPQGEAPLPLPAITITLPSPNLRFSVLGFLPCRRGSHSFDGFRRATPAPWARL